MSRERARVAPSARTRARADDPFERHPPPYDVPSDMILVAARPGLEPLRRSFPEQPFEPLGGRALLVAWFSRVLAIHYGGSPADGPARGARGRLDAVADGFPYRELNLAVLLRGGRWFVPAIYATSELTLRIGHRYGMPKRLVRMSFEADEARLASRAWAGGESFVEARLHLSGRAPAWLLERLPSWWTPTVTFPDGSWIRARIDGAARLRPARVLAGRLELREPWLPEPAPLLPWGLYLTGFRMRLPRPG